MGRVCALSANKQGSGRKGTAGGGAAPCRGGEGDVESVSTSTPLTRDGTSKDSSAARSQTRMSLSDDAVTSTPRSGMTCTALTKSRCPTVVDSSVLVCVCTGRLPRRQCPGGGQGVRRGKSDGMRLAETYLNVPHLEAPVPRPADQDLALPSPSVEGDRVEIDRGDGTRMAAVDLLRLAGLSLGLVSAETLSILRGGNRTHFESDPPDDKAALCDPCLWFSTWRRPDADRDGLARKLDRRAAVCESLGARFSDRGSARTRPQAGRQCSPREGSETILDSQELGREAESRVGKGRDRLFVLRVAQEELVGV